MVTNRRLEKKNALITGAARGIGRVIAECFAKEGANLFICDMNAESLEQTASELRKVGGKVITHVADISLQKSVQEMAQHALMEYEQIDVLVNNAGIHIGRKFIEYSLDEFDRVIRVNLYGTFLVTQAILPGMMARKKGKIVNIASSAGKWGSRDQAAYNASKHAIVGLTRCLALEMAEFNINVNAICPGLADTEQNIPLFKQRSQVLGITPEDVLKLSLSVVPMRKLIKPEEIAYLAIYLSSDESDAMTGQSIAIDGGYIMV
jgi:meso-butanediol dehydrogenase/(S,S)-butanediol dehydrogenase/diacetyl reductase